MFGRRFDLFTLFGVTIRADPSWLIVAALVSWSLATGYFPSRYPDLTGGIHWTMGVCGALGLFLSVILHEMGHALMARQVGLSIRGITLFIFGGVAEMDSEPPSAKAEFLVAVAGPVVSILIAIGSLLLTGFVWMATGSFAISGVLSYLAFINTVLVIFNMIPAFPLDGGRVLRSILWQWRQDLRWATSITSQIGRGFGIFLIALGIFEMLARQDFVGGLWMCLIGMFLKNAAQMSYRQVLLKGGLEGEKVQRFMKTDLVAVPRAISVAELVQDYVYKHHYKLFPVVDHDRLVGCVSTQQIKELPQSEWTRQTVGAIAVPCSTANTISPESEATAALTLMSRTGSSRLLVVEGDRLVGILNLEDLLQFLSLKTELEGPNPSLTGSN
jgi:Zn-dependent protease/CBS domain-containing protein